MNTRMIFTIIALALVACRGVTAPATDESSNGSISSPAGIPMQWRAVAGDGQSGRVATMLPDWIVVQVKDAKNQPVADWPVAFSIVENGGRVVRDTASQEPVTFEKRTNSNTRAVIIFTDDDGFARVRWILSYNPGQHHLTAQVRTRDGKQQLGALINFSAFATEE
jgi:hypothetical protein